MDVEGKRALYRRWLPELWNARPEDMHRIAEEVFSADAVGRWGGGADRIGPREIAEAVREAVALFDDVAVSLLAGPLVDGDLIAAQWEFAGTYSGGIPGAAAEPGTPVRYTGMDLVRVQDGRIVEYWPYGRDMSLMQQLGALG